MNQSQQDLKQNDNLMKNNEFGTSSTSTASNSIVSEKKTGIEISFEKMQID